MANDIVSHITLTTGLISYYSCDTNGSFPDAHGSNTGTINGATFTASGKINGAYDYDGNNDSVQFGNVFNASTTYSRFAWINPDTLGTQACILSKYNAGGTDREYLLLRLSTGKLGVLFYSTTGSTSIFLTGNIVCPIGTWCQVGFTYDGTTVRLYVDGSEDVNSSTISGTPKTNGTGNFLIGALDFNNQVFDGRIDEVGMWSKTLTPTEVSDLWNSGDGLPYELPATFFTINCTNINTFDADVGGTPYSTTNGEIITTIEQGSAQVEDIVLSAPGFYDEEYDSYDTDNNLSFSFDSPIDYFEIVCTNINTFDADIGGVPYNTTDGTIITTIDKADALIKDIVCSTAGYRDETFDSYDTSVDISFSFDTELVPGIYCLDGEYVTSKSIFFGLGVVNSIVITSIQTGTWIWEVTADGGSNWETVTGVETGVATIHEFTNTGDDVRYRVTADGETSTIAPGTKIEKRS